MWTTEYTPLADWNVGRSSLDCGQTQGTPQWYAKAKVGLNVEHGTGEMKTENQIRQRSLPHLPIHNHVMETGSGRVPGVAAAASYFLWRVCHRSSVLHKWPLQAKPVGEGNDDSISDVAPRTLCLTHFSHTLLRAPFCGDVLWPAYIKDVR